MKNALTRHLDGRNETPQTEPIPGREAEMGKNAAGGVVFKLDKWEQFRRFLILGTEGGTYYTSERKLTAGNVAVVETCVAENGQRAVNLIVEVSEGGIAPKNTQAIYALAVAAGAANTKTRQAANAAIGRVCRTGTHLYEFVDYIDLLGQRGWGRGLTSGIARVLEEMPLKKLALHSVKYRQRNGQTYARVLRRTHPQTDEVERNLIFQHMLGKADKDELGAHESLGVIEGFYAIQEAGSDKEAIRLIEEYNLPWEAVPDQFRKSAAVWEAILPNSGLMAITRNLATFARLGMLTPMGATEQFIVGKLTDDDAIAGSRMHPIHFLNASRVHASGGSGGLSRGATYTVNHNVVKALDKAFKKAFKSVEPTGKRHYLGLDVSGSMGFQACAGTAITPREGSAAMALVTDAVEPLTYVAGFTGGSSLTPINLGSSLTSAIRSVSGLPFGGTDCALPMLDALKKGIEVDQFVVYTDNETWAGSMAPVQALQKYRKETEIPAKLAVVGMTSTGFSIADPTDAGMMDFVGFDASTPKAISIFASE